MSRQDEARAVALARDLCETGRALHDALRRVRELEAEVERLTRLLGLLRGVA